MQRKCMVRFDDITPDMNWVKFDQGMELLNEYGMKPLLGIVPCNQDQNLSIEEEKDTFWEEMRQLQEQGIIVAQHGYNHVYETEESGILRINPFSEFAGLSYQDQYEKLRAGQAILQSHGIHTNVFMAPGHSFDKNTLKALKELGFSFITDGLTKRPYKRSGICFIPCDLTDGKQSKIHTICIHTNSLTNLGLEELRGLLEIHKEHLCDYTVTFEKNTFLNYGMIQRMEEFFVISKRKWKNNLAQSEAMSSYFIKTNHGNPIVKLVKRILGIPFLIKQLMIHGGK